MLINGGGVGGVLTALTVTERAAQGEQDSRPRCSRGSDLPAHSHRGSRRRDRGGGGGQTDFTGKGRREQGDGDINR